MRPKVNTACLMLVDVQEKLFYRIEGHSRIEQRLCTLVQGLQTIGTDKHCKP